jgi:alpha-soluble NSF attachment protein
LKNYEEQNVSFAASRECQFLGDVLHAVETYDVDYFTKAVVEYDSITPLKPWYTEILLTIKKTIPDNNEPDLTMRDDQDDLT